MIVGSCVDAIKRDELHPLMQSTYFRPGRLPKLPEFLSCSSFTLSQRKQMIPPPMRRFGNPNKLAYKFLELWTLHRYKPASSL